ncbi:MAG: hypothetical protein K2V38_15840 [Gemmataceae bacterium]|nr:hypothetical protein [Gemmataceae bacterium]
MPAKTRCPACNAPHHRDAEPGESLVCEMCGEVFEARLLASGAKSAPASEPKPRNRSRAGEPATDRPSGRSADRPRRKPSSRPERSRRRPASGGNLGVLVGGGLLLLLVFGLAIIGGGVFLVNRKVEQARLERAQEEAQRAEEDRRRADAERLAQLRAWERLNNDKPEPKQPNPAPGRPEPARPDDPFRPDPGFPGEVFPGVPPGAGVGPIPGGPGQVFPPMPGGRPPVPEEPPEPPKQALPEFKEPANPNKAGAQTKLREIKAVPLPKLPAPPKNDRPWDQPTHEHFKMAYSPKRELLFVLSPKQVWVYDVKAGKEVGAQAARERFTDLSLSPDGSALFAADYGGTNIGYGTPSKPSWVHRFDLAGRKWEERKAPKIAYRVETVDGARVLLLEQDQWVSVTLNKWEEDGVGVRELARARSDYYGDIEYNPRTGHILHGSTGSSSQQVTVNQLSGDGLKKVGDTGTYGSGQGGGPTVVLSQDGSRLYYGALQFPTEDLTKAKPVKMQGTIVAASRDVAFGGQAYYRATTGSKLGEFPFKTTSGDPNRGERVADAVITVSPDGLSVWVIDRDKNVARQFALESDKE